MEFFEEAVALFGESSGGGGGRDEGRVDIDPTIDLFANIGSGDGELFFANVLFLPLGLVDRAPYFSAAAGAATASRHAREGGILTRGRPDGRRRKACKH